MHSPSLCPRSISRTRQTPPAGRPPMTSVRFPPPALGCWSEISGGDPYTIGPQRDYPAGVPLWLRLKLLSSAGGSCQVFYFSNVATEAASVRFTVPAGQWTEGRVAVPALGPGYRMRVDPPGTTGTATLASLRFEARERLSRFRPGHRPRRDELDRPARHRVTHPRHRTAWSSPSPAAIRTWPVRRETIPPENCSGCMCG